MKKIVQKPSKTNAFSNAPIKFISNKLIIIEIAKFVTQRRHNNTTHNINVSYVINFVVFRHVSTETLNGI